MLTEQIDSDWKTAVKAGQTFEKNVLTNVRSAIKSWKIDNLVKTDLTDEQVCSVMDRLVKQLRDSIEQAQSRPEAVASMQKEISVIEAYLPKKLDRETVAAIIKKVIADGGYDQAGQFGEVMKKNMTLLKGKADSSVIASLTRELLG